MKRVFRRLAIAFSLYSRIPIPHFVWDEDDTGHAAAYLPFIGLVIGLTECVANRLAIYLGFPELAQIALYSFIPLIITGGFHLDGFMDVEDALSSYREKEEKLRILKDPHIGAFSVIRFSIMACLWIFGMSLLLKADSREFYVFAVMFCQIRACAGLVGIFVPHAKKDGMLNMETVNVKTGKTFKTDAIQLFALLAVSLVIIGLIDWKSLVIIAAAEIMYFLVFRKKIMDNFGGVTGDTIGYYLVCTETMCLAVIGLLGCI